MAQSADGGVKTGFTLPISNSNIFKTLSVTECKELAKKGSYVNFTKKILDFVSQCLSGTSYKIWTFLSSETVFDQNWSITISNKSIAKHIKRSTRQVSRLLEELLLKGFLEKLGSYQRLNTWGVRLPSSIADELKSIKVRRQPPIAQTIRDKNVIHPGGFSFIINTNNNNEAEQTLKLETPAQVLTTVVASQAEIERLEQEKEKLNKEYTDISEEIVKKPDQKWPLFDKKQKIGEKITSIDVEIQRQRPRSAWPQYADPWVNFNFFAERHKTKILSALSGSDAPEKIIMEIGWAIQKGSLRRGIDGQTNSVDKAVNIALLLYRRGDWRTPIGYSRRN